MAVMSETGPNKLVVFIIIINYTVRVNIGFRLVLVCEYFACATLSMCWFWVVMLLIKINHSLGSDPSVRNCSRCVVDLSWRGRCRGGRRFIDIALRSDWRLWGRFMRGLPKWPLCSPLKYADM